MSAFHNASVGVGPAVIGLLYLLSFAHAAHGCVSQVGFMVQTYADKLAGLELELFHQVVNSLVFGSQHVSQSIKNAPPLAPASRSLSRALCCAPRV